MGGTDITEDIKSRNTIDMPKGKSTFKISMDGDPTEDEGTYNLRIIFAENKYEGDNCKTYNYSSKIRFNQELDMGKMPFKEKYFCYTDSKKLTILITL